MSQENVEIVRGAFEHFERTGEPLLETLHPEVEVFDHDIPDAGVYRGREGYVQWLADWSEAWGSFRLEPLRWIDAGDQVIFVFQLVATGKGSGVEVKRRDAMVLTLRDRMTIRVDYYNNEEQALEAVGLSEQDAHADS
jgi:ketosteroid isomerase-like protein